MNKRKIIKAVCFLGLLVCVLQLSASRKHLLVNEDVSSEVGISDIDNNIDTEESVDSDRNTNAEKGINTEDNANTVDNINTKEDVNSKENVNTEKNLITEDNVNLEQQVNAEKNMTSEKSINTDNKMSVAEDIVSEEGASKGVAGTENFSLTADSNGSSTTKVTITPKPTIAVKKSNQFESLDSLINSKVKAGDVCEILGYYKKNDGGRAKFRIVNQPKLKANGCTIYSLKNGMKAKLIIENKNINVMVAGIQPETKVSKKLNKLIKLLSGKADSLVFNEGRYLIDAPIYLKTFSYVGNGDVEFFVTSDFNSPDDKIFTTHEDYKKGIISKVTFKNLDFTFECVQGSTRVDKVNILVQLTGLDYCLIDNCNFRAYQPSTNGAFHTVELLFLRNSDFSNITITNSKFENRACANEDDILREGGCIWIWGGDDNNWKNLENVTIASCEFINSNTDETLGIWSFNAKNINIINNTFTTVSHQCDNLITFTQLNITDSIVKNCKFNINTTCMYIFKAVQNNSADLKISDCTFNLNNNIAAPWDKNISVFAFSNTELLLGETVEGRMDYVSYDVSNCKVTSTDNTEYRVLINCKNTKANLTNSQIEANLSGGVVWIEDAKGEVKVKNNYINTKNSKLLLVLKNTRERCSITMSNNTIVQPATAYLTGYVTMDYTFTENKLLCKEEGYLINCEAATFHRNASNMIFLRNEIENKSNLLGVYGNSYNLNINSDEALLGD